MLVRALREGFQAGQRRMPGSVFDMDVKSMKRLKDGKLVMPGWVESAEKPAAPERSEQQPQAPSPSKGQQVI